MELHEMSVEVVINTDKLQYTKKFELKEESPAGLIERVDDWVSAFFEVLSDD